MKKKDEKFLKDYCIKKTDFNATRHSFEELEEIRNDYKKFKKELELAAEFIIKRLYAIDRDKLHSVRYRIKDEEHLIEKIIRKKIEKPEARKITKENYRNEISDLIGIRVLHLYKNDWLYIHDFIRDTWGFKERPTAWLKQGDEGIDYKEKGCEIDYKPNNYQSIHYVISTKPSAKEHLVEIQTRTIFEEGWCEIDHNIRYPNKSKNLVLEKFLNIFNNFAESANDMGFFVKELDEYLRGKDAQINDLKEEVKRLNITEQEKKDLEKKISNLEEKESLFLTSLNNRSQKLFTPNNKSILSFNNFSSKNTSNYFWDADKYKHKANLNSLNQERICNQCGEVYRHDISSVNLDNGKCDECQDKNNYLTGSPFSRE